MEKFVPNLKRQYKESVSVQLLKEFGYTSKMQIPALEKIVVSVGVGEAIVNKKLLDSAVKELEQITGQQPASPSRTSSSARGWRSVRW